MAPVVILFIFQTQAEPSSWGSLKPFIYNRSKAVKSWDCMWFCGSRKYGTYMNDSKSLKCQVSSVKFQVSSFKCPQKYIWTLTRGIIWWALFQRNFSMWCNSNIFWQRRHQALLFSFQCRILFVYRTQHLTSSFFNMNHIGNTLSIAIV